MNEIIKKKNNKQNFLLLDRRYSQNSKLFIFSFELPKYWNYRYMPSHTGEQKLVCVFHIQSSDFMCIVVCGPSEDSIFGVSFLVKGFFFLSILLFCICKWIENISSCQGLHIFMNFGKSSDNEVFPHSICRISLQCKFFHVC